MDTNLLALAILILVSSLAYLKLRTDGRGKLFPGPRPSILSNAAPPPDILPWKLFAQLRAAFGDIAYIDSFGGQLLVLNSARATRELLDKRSAYSSRPNRLMILDAMGWDCMFSEMLYGQKWRKYRSLFEKHYSPRAVAQYEPIQLGESRTLLRNLLVSPQDFSQHLQRSATALIMMINYGHRISESEDRYVTLSDHAMSSIIKAGIPGTYWIDWLPLLNYVPLWFPAPFRKVGNACRAATKAMVEEPYKMVKERMLSGQDVPCLVSRELQDKADTNDSPEDITMIKSVAAMGYAAGGETTVSGLHTFILAMTLYPEVQRKAQAQLQQILAEGRLPQFSDRPKLPYINLIVWEVMRWNPVVPLALAHATTQDDTFEGHWVPKGTTVVPNVWAICHDEEKYPAPFTFNPERFEDTAANQRLGINPIPWETFGFGRRICPGRWLAIDTLWITVASVLSVYDISKMVDKAGKKIEPSQEYTLGLSSRPKPFECSIVPRSESAVALINESQTETY